MARTLKYAIQIFWAVFGLYALLSLIGMVGLLCFMDYRFLTHSALSMELLGCFFVLPMIALLAAFVYTAFVALFRFSFAIISPTVCIVSLGMFMIFLHELVRFSEPMLENHHQPIASLVYLTLLFGTMFGAIYFYRFTVDTIRRMLFPELNHSAARIF